MHFIVEIDWHILVIIRFDSMGDLSLVGLHKFVNCQVI